MYGAPIWANSLTAQGKTLLRRPQRVITVRVSRAYRTTSYEAACVMAELSSEGEKPLLEHINRWRINIRRAVFRKWQEKLEEPRSGHWTIGAIRPVLAKWADRSWGGISYHLAQVLTGHGCFGKYLCRVGREPTTACPAFDEQRSTLTAVVGHDLSLLTVVRAMVGSERAWNAVASFCTDVLPRKEAAEQEREEDPSSHPMRRKRLGRRRLAYARQLPP
ncbi:uncharacterized protein LOC113227367 [Hyposmocoma kahamanoa]|uniref:uncharacterized protein LOC113227367 n=1 Tax=Hyposmocoma kahamanoa TaxID=1477025 RepID=UPI000E6D8516|nr:uncharacterized protein LOC113227367 [Hyposmocoma kahamanoa]